MKLRGISGIPTIISLLIVLIGCTSTNDDGWISTEYSQQKADELQKQVDEGHKPGALDWRQVSRDFLSSNEMKVNESTDSKLIVDEKTKKVVQYELTDGRLIQLELVQPSKEGPSGIYMVNRYRFLSK